MAVMSLVCLGFCGSGYMDLALAVRATLLSGVSCMTSCSTCAAAFFRLQRLWQWHPCSPLRTACLRGLAPPLLQSQGADDKAMSQVHKAVKHGVPQLWAPIPTQLCQQHNGSCEPYVAPRNIMFSTPLQPCGGEHRVLGRCQRSSWQQGSHLCLRGWGQPPSHAQFSLWKGLQVSQGQHLPEALLQAAVCATPCGCIQHALENGSARCLSLQVLCHPVMLAAVLLQPYQGIDLITKWVMPFAQH